MHRVPPRSVWLPAVLFGATAWACLALTLQFAATPELWIASGLLVGLLLDRPRAQQFAAIPLAWLANSMANVAAGYSPGLAAGLAVANCLEVSIALWALGGW